MEAQLALLRSTRARLEAIEADLIVGAERIGLPQRRGFGSTTGWLIAITGDPHGVCRARVVMARGLRHMPRVRGAFSRGGLSEARVRSLVRAREVDPEAFGRDEEVLLSQAESLPAGEFETALAYWRRLADAEGHLADHERAYRNRGIHASVTWKGTVRVDGDLDPEGGATLIAALRSLTDPSQLDPADARSPAQRRADALVEIARRHLDRSDRPVVGGERPHVALLVDLEALRGSLMGACELDTGAVPPSVARRIACDSTLAPIIAHDGVVVGAGRASRVIPAAMRRAVIARDRHCTHPGCTVPAAWCDVHHIVHWSDGGATVLDNLTLLCRRHHRLTHRLDPRRLETTTHRPEPLRSAPIGPNAPPRERG